ncbi:TRAP transporter permease [Chloroflexota bacterium]
MNLPDTSENGNAVEQKEPIGQHRELHGVWRLIPMLMAAFALSWSIGLILDLQRRAGLLLTYAEAASILIALFLPLVFVYFPATKSSPRNKIPWYDILLGLFCIVGPAYFYMNFREGQVQGWEVVPPTSAIVIGICTLLLVVEAARRSSGLGFTIIGIIFAALPFYSHLLPGILESRVFRPDQVIGYYFMGTDAIWGLPARVFSKLIIVYIAFGLLIQVSGGSRFFINLAMSLLGSFRGGPAKVAVIGSALFGSLSGSSAANVAVTGAVTIPMMKRTGWKSYYACAIEAAASTGGLLMPPVMGAAAFIVADYLDISYWKIALAAVLPTILYFIGLFGQVHFHAVKNQMSALPRSELPSFRKTLMEGWYFIPVAITLLYYLMIAKIDPARAGLYACAALVLFTAPTKDRFTWSKIIEFIELCGRTFAMVGALLLLTGVLMGGLFLTGFGIGIAQLLTDIGTTNMTLLAIVAFFASFILGMGSNVVVVYILLAMLVAPAMETAGLNRLAVHLGLLYWGTLSFLTPPVAISSYIAAGFGGAPPMKTAIQSTRLAIATFVVPFVFIFHPALVLEGSALDTFTLFIASAFAIWLFAMGIEGWLMRANRTTDSIARLLCIIAGGMLLTTILPLQIAGGAIGVVIILSPHVIEKYYADIAQRLRNKN